MDDHEQHLPVRGLHTMPTPITLTSPLADDLLFDAMTHSAGLSALEEMQLHMLSERSDIRPEDMLASA